MKKILFLLVSAFVMCTSVVLATENNDSNSTNVEEPVVCKFSLSKYKGTLSSGGQTETFNVLLNCAQGNDVSATVYLKIDGEVVASKVVTISAGKKSSGDTTISVGREYAGKTYTLTVI